MNICVGQLIIFQVLIMILKSPDFIIPFLISHSAEAIARTQTNTKKKRYSVPNKSKEVNTNSSMELTKIYKTNRRKSAAERPEKEKSPTRQEKVPFVEREEKQGEEFLLREKGRSQLQLTLQKSPYIARNRFLKAHSLINHIPAFNYSDDPISPPKFSPKKDVNSTKKEVTSPKKDMVDPKKDMVDPKKDMVDPKKDMVDPKKDFQSPIPGVRFKRSAIFNQSANLFTPQPGHFDEDYHSQFAGKIKHWRQKKQWSRKRSANVDFIINRRCKNFNDLVNQYRKRLSLPETARIFIFNSKDLWMKRALAQRGWIQNANKESRAFHLYWSNKVIKENVFPQQVLNHYQSSDLLTSKAGLHRMLLKYGLEHLQPMTFDLALQRSQFILYYTKLAFLSGLRKLIKKFDFQEEPTNVGIEELRMQVGEMKRRPGMRGVIQADLMGLLESCFMLIDGRLHELTTCYLDNALFKIHSMLELNRNEEELVRVLRDFHMICARHRLFDAEIALGDENIWLSKSKNSSKGVGISLHKDLDDILKHSNRLAQKYIQNPLIFTSPSTKGRKFDIRIWVLLVGNLNARVYYHQRFYGRLCFEAYSLDTIDLDNQKKHLTNYSHNKLSFRDDALAHSVLLPETIFQLVKEEKGIQYRNLFFQKLEGILSKMGSIFRNEMAAGNPNSFQLFGLDLLIDDHLNLHLLQVNLSAACQERHEALSSMMKDVAHGLLNILQGRNGPNDVRGWRFIK